MRRFLIVFCLFFIGISVHAKQFEIINNSRTETVIDIHEVAAMSKGVNCIWFRFKNSSKLYMIYFPNKHVMNSEYARLLKVLKSRGE